jgi:Flp pilus assembly pilin Flp
MADKTIRLCRLWWRRLTVQTEAATAAEYAIMMALIIIVSVGAIRAIGERFFNLYVMIANAVGATM